MSTGGADPPREDASPVFFGISESKLSVSKNALRVFLIAGIMLGSKTRKNRCYCLSLTESVKK